MNSKLIAIIAVVAMCGAALVGVGYAYQASYTPEDTSIAVSNANYITITPTNGATGVGTWTAIGDVDYDTTTSSTGTTTYTPVGASLDGDGDNTKLTKTLTMKYQVTIDFQKSGVASGDDVTLNVTASTPSYGGSNIVNNITFNAVSIYNNAETPGDQYNVDGGTWSSVDSITVKSNGSTVDVTLYLVCDVVFGSSTNASSIQTDGFTATSTVEFTITA